MSKTKDPAVLFYTADFLADTTLWTYEELGRYIKLLCIQHLQGGVSEDDFIAVVGTCKRVSDKFTKGEDGLYRNKRMAEEAESRRKFTESRRANAYKRNTSNASAELVHSICNASAEHMENENINGNINVNIIKDVIAWLNKCSGNDFDYTSKFISSLVASCIERGYTYDDLIAVINFKFEEWAGTDMAKYLRPSTLFGDKFDQYLAEARKQERTEERETLARFNTFNPEAAFRAAITNTYGGEENVT